MRVTDLVLRFPSKQAGQQLGSAMLRTVVMTMVAAMTATYAVCRSMDEFVHLGRGAGSSMAPTLINNESNVRVFEEFSSRVLGRAYQVGDVVIAVEPSTKQEMCKRIRAVGGQTVRCCPHSASDWLVPCEELTIPAGHVWLAGDNPSDSWDSRCFGPLPEDHLRGRVLFQLSLSLSSAAVPAVPVLQMVVSQRPPSTAEVYEIIVL